MNIIGFKAKGIARSQIDDSTCFIKTHPTVDDPSQKTVPPRKLIIFQFREMIFLPDLSDGETSDNMANVEEDEDDDEVVLNSNPGFNR